MYVAVYTYQSMWVYCCKVAPSTWLAKSFSLPCLQLNVEAISAAGFSLDKDNASNFSNKKSSPHC